MTLCSEYTLNAVENVLVRESQDRDALCFDLPLPYRIVPGLIVVAPAVELNHKVGLLAEEVDYEAADRVLAAKLCVK